MILNPFTGTQDLYQTEKVKYHNEECMVVHFHQDGLVNLKRPDGSIHFGVHPNSCEKLNMPSSKKLAVKISESINEGVKENSITDMIIEHEKELITQYKILIQRLMHNNPVFNLEHSQHSKICTYINEKSYQWFHQYRDLSK
jgi:hypothetical protein